MKKDLGKMTKPMSAKEWLVFVGTETYQGTKVMQDYADYLSGTNEMIAFKAGWEKAIDLYETGQLRGYIDKDFKEWKDNP